MIYDERVTLFSYVETKDELGSPIRTRVPKVVPCGRGTLTHNQQIGLFGQYDLNAFTLHLQGVYRNVDEVEFEGVIRRAKAVKHHKHSTVIVI